MNSRVELALILSAAFLGHRASSYMSDSVFQSILVVGWVVFIIWTVVAYRRGERVSWLQRSPREAGR